eukprot:TRINITY_DN7660_c0_g1_i1.p1 TRINITY_DN7660_c0_g1~~TRINITY_DN7660_c0_g1_i1.p1  ORF type:complete len:304 (+),score=56.07 TRINITY_DN7660_c0_g1_i1:23-934(+)
MALDKIEEIYSLKEEIGRGAFSVVRLGVHKKTGEKVAVKIIDKSSLGADVVRLETEINILKKVSHPNIIHLKELIETPSILAIITELVTGGELFDKIVEQGSYSEKDAATLITKMVSAIEYLHEQGIVHRDLKPENLLLKSDEDITEVKLADFGLSKIVGTQNMMMTACGTPSYVAPEVLSASGYDREVDLWSIGVITYILLCGFPPFYHENLGNLFEDIMAANYDFPEDYWNHISKEAKDFIKRLLVVNPAERMTAAQARSHGWLQKQKVAVDHKLPPQFKSKMKEYNEQRKFSNKSLTKLV